MWWLWVILGLIFGPMVIVGLILLIPIGLDIVYNVDGLEAWFYLGSYRTMLYPERKGNAFIQETGRKLVNKTTEVTTKAIKAVKEEGGGFNEFIPLLKIVLGFFGDLFRKVRLKHLQMRLILASTDPCNLALSYGRAWMAVGNLMPVLESVFTIKKRDVGVECDFLSTETRIFVRFDAKISLGRFLLLLFTHAFKAVVELDNLTNQNEGGANHERETS